MDTENDSRLREIGMSHNLPPPGMGDFKETGNNMKDKEAAFLELDKRYRAGEFSDSSVAQKPALKQMREAYIHLREVDKFGDMEPLDFSDKIN